MWENLKVVLLFVLNPAVLGFPVFTFSDTFYPPAPPSFASLTRKVELPDTFILCSSSKQARFDNLGFFSILGEDGTHWLSVVFWQYTQAVDIWITWNRGWYNLGPLARHSEAYLDG